MRIISDTKKIDRNRKIGLYTLFGSLITWVIGLVLSFQNVIGYAYAALLAGLILSQIGFYYGNRWGRTPRIDERLTQGLKGLDDRYTLYHYRGPVPHILTGPSGVWVLVPQYQEGTIVYEKERFRQQGVGVFKRLFAQEGLGRPDLEAQGYQQDMVKFLKKQLPEDKAMPEVQPLIVFINPKASVQTTDSPIPALHVDKLKDFIRRKLKVQSVSMNIIGEVEEVLPQESL
jgi:hypothetical protein